MNLFILNDFLSFLISAAGLLIFIGLTAYDTQKIRNWIDAEPQPEAVKKLAVRGALTLYLDFINIFLNVLRLMGKRRN